MNRKLLLMSMLLLFVITGWTQVFQNGIRKGMIKVKFSSDMTTTLSKLRVNTTSNRLSTGINSIDAVAQTASAKNMYRLFPVDARYEDRLQKHGLHLWYVVEIDQNTDPKIAVQQFKQLKEVSTAEVDREKAVAPHTITPYNPSTTGTFDVLPFNDPYLKDQWHYHNTGQSGYGNADVNLFNAWTKTAGANNIIVSVHDQGVDVNHSDLKENIWINTIELNGVAGKDDDGNGYVDDINGYNFEKNIGAIDPQYHATHVAGTIAAVNNNGKGVSGVAGGSGKGDGVKIMSMQIMGGAPIEKSYVYAANNGAVISQNSWGYTSPGSFDQSVLDAIDYFIAEAGNYPGSPMKGGIVFFAAGNSNSDGDWYPGYHSSIMAVASIGPEWKKASYSNFGSWVEISAPGGDQQYGSKSGILSTIPNEQYAYLQGTSMACPHVSGIAALALANRTHQLTNAELWNKMITGTVNIDSYNGDYLGKLGTGAIDASLVIQNDQGIAPQAIADLTLTGIAQEFATLSWTVPLDTDDGKPLFFQLYYSTQPITLQNLSGATKAEIKNQKAVGDSFAYEVDGLLGLTTYYFAITSTDRWGNVSVLSNVITGTTNAGPSIAVDPNSQNISMNIDATSSSMASQDIAILNNAAGILRWNYFMRHSNSSPSYNAASLHYPVITTNKSGAAIKVSKVNANTSATRLKSKDPVAYSFIPVEKTYSDWATNLIGETDLTITNSAGARFYVSDSNGFNLTQARMYLKHDPAKGPVIFEVYKGVAPTKNNLIYAQEYSNYSTEEQMAYINLNEQLYFETGSTFWLVFHVPAGNLFPLGMGYELAPSYSQNCFMSFDLGASWAQLEDLIKSSSFAWTITAASYNEYLGNYLTLNPGSGVINGVGQMNATLTADATHLVNGSYSANLVLASNDPNQKELRVPVTVSVSGHQPDIKHIDIADYGSVFKGTFKNLELVLDNQGYGNFNAPNFTIDNPQFSIEGYAPWQIKARESVVVNVKFSPTTSGNTNGILTITNGNQSYQVMLFGVGAETSQISITPENQVVNNVAIGDVVNAQVTIQNSGAYPLKYFIPGYDTKGVSTNWPVKYHKYGYKFRTNYGNEANPLTYSFQNISLTGTKITDQLIDDAAYVDVDMGFDFPYYGQLMHKIYIAQKGFTTFDNSVRPINSPVLNSSYSPKGYISPLGGYFDYVSQGNIYYQVEADRIIIQYDNVWDGYTVGESITAQMVLYANGDIRFFYDNMGYSSFNQTYLNILVEDLNQSDGILISNYQHPIQLWSGLALGLDYPGPDIITSVDNGSGILSPGSSAIVNVQLSTASLVEGTTNRYISFISNDPSNAQKSALVQLEITSGGTPHAIVSTDTISFGDVFQGANRSSSFTIKNTGTSNVAVSNMNFVNSQFSLTGNTTISIKPGFYEKYDVKIPTASLTTLNDWLSINYADGSHDTISVSGKVVNAPNILVDLSLLQDTLAYGGTSSHPFSIQNTGLAPLEVTAVGKQWLTFDLSAADEVATTQGTTYTFEKHNDGSFYQWFDLLQTGTHMPFTKDVNDKHDYWKTVNLPFTIEYYGKKYDSLKVGDNGIISFNTDSDLMWFEGNIPSANYPGTFLMPYWTFGGFDATTWPKEKVGVFYQFYDDKIVITWSYLVNNFGEMGDPVSAQVIFYKNGTTKFQYKVEEGGQDLSSVFTSIGMQENSNSGISISDHLRLDHGKGLAYIITPAKKRVIAPGTTLTGQININAMNIFGGVYNEALKLQTNVPGSEKLEKPVQLVVNGVANFVAPDTISFGKKMVSVDGNYMDLNFSNDGAAPVEITWAQMADGTQGLSLMLMADGWFGPEWTDISNIYSPWAWVTPTYKINPGDKLAVRTVFYPNSAGDFSDELVLSTSIGEKRIVLKGTSFEPPVLQIDNFPVNVSMNTMTETATKSIAFDNVNGKSDLEYSISIDYNRAAPSGMSIERMASGALQASKLLLTVAEKSLSPVTLSTYDRIIKYTTKDAPDNFVGMGGGAPFTVATKYNAGPEGFNLSHVVTWFRTEGQANGTIQVKIRAGGTSIADAIPVADGSLDFTGSGNDAIGSWYAIALNSPAGIYPNEDFYVIITYPMDLSYPQAIVKDEPTVAGRYYYDEEGTWNDIQAVPGFEKAGWLMYAAQQTAGSSAWLNITSSLSGTLTIGDTTSTKIFIQGAIAMRGDQTANIVFKTNDPSNKEVKIPVTLHMNEAPQFIDVPVALQVKEKDTVTFEIAVTDKEGNSFGVQAAQTYKGVTYALSNGVLSITMMPDYGDAGNYQYTFIATDEFNAQRQIVLPTQVIHTNRAPEYIAATDPFVGYRKGLQKEFVLTDLFQDPDGDSMTFTATSAPGVVEIFSSAQSFIVKAIAAGQTDITFTLNDNHGGQTIKTLPVFVDVVMGDITITSENFFTSPNPTNGKMTITIPSSDEGSIRILNIMGIELTRFSIVSGVTTYQLDIENEASGLYLAELNNGRDKKVIRIVKK